ncbi:MAG: hypothetical protein J5I90_02435 [Caldilineales bacterium]|nr:hypothetical protein [Caldilineales bacterium]
MELIATLDDQQTKAMLKNALVELIEERRDVFSDIFVEAMEEVGLAQAIREGRRDDFVEEEEVFAVLGQD